MYKLACDASAVDKDICRTANHKISVKRKWNLSRERVFSLYLWRTCRKLSGSPAKSSWHFFLLLLLFVSLQFQFVWCRLSLLVVAIAHIAKKWSPHSEAARGNEFLVEHYVLWEIVSLSFAKSLNKLISENSSRYSCLSPRAQWEKYTRFLKWKSLTLYHTMCNLCDVKFCM